MLRGTTQLAPSAGILARRARHSVAPITVGVSAESLLGAFAPFGPELVG